MIPHWSAATGAYRRSVSHTAVASLIGVVAVLIAGIVSVAEPSLRDLDVAARTWGLVLYISILLKLGGIVLFSPEVLATLLATPANEKRIYELLDSTQDKSIRALPYFFGLVLATSLVRDYGWLWALAGAFYSIALLRLLLPVLFWLSVVLRKLFVPFGHLLIWVVVLGMAIGLLGEQPIPVVDLVFVLGGHAPLLWIPIGVVLIILTGLLRPALADASAGYLGREELLAYAYPLEGAHATQRRRRTVVEVLRGGPRIRRFLFLVEESYELYRPADWLRGFIVWLLSLLAILVLAEGAGGSGVQLLAVFGSIFTLDTWAVLRRWRLNKLRIFKALGNYAVPIGHVEMVVSHLVVISVLYLVGSIVALLFVYFSTGPEVLYTAKWAGCALVSESAGGAVSSTLTNAVQGWLLMIALIVGMVTRDLGDQTVRGTFPQFAWMSVFAVLATAVFSGAYVLGLAIEPAWGALLAHGLRLVALLFGGVGLGVEPALGDSILDGSITRLAPLWQFEAAAWAVALLLFVLAWTMFLRRRSGKCNAEKRSRM